MTEDEQKAARAAIDIAAMVWNGWLEFDKGVWFIERNCLYRDVKAEETLTKLVAALASRNLEKMLKGTETGK